MTSSTDRHIHQPTAGRFAATPASFLHLMVAGWTSRLAVKRLGRLDERLLKDIGVARNDIGWALNLPLTADAEIALFDRVRRRGL